MSETTGFPAGSGRDANLAATRRWKVTLYEGGFTVDAATAHEARIEALQAVAESLDLFDVEENE